MDGTYIHNKAKDSIHNIPRATEKELHNLIIESKIYISKEGYNQKKIGLEKIWDAFERLKTIKGIDKKFLLIPLLLILQMVIKKFLKCSITNLES